MGLELPEGIFREALPSHVLIRLQIRNLPNRVLEPPEPFAQRLRRANNLSANDGQWARRAISNKARQTLAAFFAT